MTAVPVHIDRFESNGFISCADTTETCTSTSAVLSGTSKYNAEAIDDECKSWVDASRGIPRMTHLSNERLRSRVSFSGRVGGRISKNSQHISSEVRSKKQKMPNVRSSRPVPPSLRWTKNFVALSIVFIITIVLITRDAAALKSSATYVPQGTNSLLYSPGDEPIMQLDQLTFTDTVFEKDKAQGFIVEFYADWCGHCRAYVPIYRELSARLYNWKPVVQVAAMNCADNFNSQVCGANGVSHFPMLKYFPRTATTFNDGMDLDPVHDAQNVFDQLADKIVNEYNLNRYRDWPNFSFLQIYPLTRYENLWDGGEPSAKYLLLVFEEFKHSSGATIGLQLIFQLLPHRQHIVVRRVLSTSPLASMLNLTQYPYVAMFRPNDQTSIFMEPAKLSTAQKVLGRLQPDQAFTAATTPRTFVPHTTAAPVYDCKAKPAKCQSLYFASESDMLKAIHMALVDEVARPNGYIRGKNFTHLYNFVTLLNDYFPVISLGSNNKNNNNDDKRNRRSELSGSRDGAKNVNHFGEYRIRVRRADASISPRILRNTPQSQSTALVSKTLPKSERARSVFAHMLRVLEESRNTSKEEDLAISANVWRDQFTTVEHVYANPFPKNASWQHCRGTTPEYRGYTCALWTTFHTLTVHAYLRNLKPNNSSARESPMRSLKAIQGWVDSFFGCQHCRNHFMEMTTKKFPMNETIIRHPRDAIMYLWRAHNIVNKRLHGQSTEDPQFQKYQFPPAFLCPSCSTGNGFSRRNIRQFLVNYYTNIRPVD